MKTVSYILANKESVNLLFFKFPNYQNECLKVLEFFENYQSEDIQLRERVIFVQYRFYGFIF